MHAAVEEIFDRVCEKYGGKHHEWDFESAVKDRNEREDEREEEEEDGTAAKKRRLDLDLRDPLDPTQPKLNVVRTITSMHLFKNIRPEDLARVVVSETMFINLVL